MKYELRKLSIDDGRDVYEMLQDIGKAENGFTNRVNVMSFEEYQRWLIRSDKSARSTLYWLYVDGKPVGIGKLRYFLTDRLRVEGGHIRYAIRPSARNKKFAR